MGWPFADVFGGSVDVQHIASVDHRGRDVGRDGQRAARAHTCARDAISALATCGIKPCAQMFPISGAAPRNPNGALISARFVRQIHRQIDGWPLVLGNGDIYCHGVGIGGYGRQGCHGQGKGGGGAVHESS